MYPGTASCKALQCTCLVPVSVFVSWGLLFGSQQAFRVVGAGLQMQEKDGMWNVDQGTESCRNGPICWRNSIPSTSFPLPPPACGQEAGPRTRLLLKVAERGGGRQVHGTRQWGCLNFRGRLNSRLSPLPPVIGDLAAEGGGGKGTGETRERASAARGQVLGGPGANFCSPPLALEERRLHVEMGAGGGQGAAFSAAAGASPNGPRGAAAGPGWGASGAGTPGPPRPRRGSPAQSLRRGGVRRAPA